MGSEGWKAKLGGDTSGPTTLLLPLPPICLVFFFRTFREIAIQFCLGTYAFEPQENKIKWGWPPGWIWVVGGLKKKRQAPKTAHREILDWIVPVCTAQGGSGSFKDRKPIGGWLL